jgi:tetratricopeptide (TPR) repeat protein
MATAQNQQYSSTVSAQSSTPRTQLAMSTPGLMGGMQSMRSEASVLFSGGQYAAAADTYTRLMQLGSTEASDRYWLGESLYHAGNYQQAAAAFEQAVQISPKLAQAYVRLTETYLALHLKDKAYQSSLAGLNVVGDPYMKEQLSNLSKAAIHQETKPTRVRDLRAHRMPSES